MTAQLAGKPAALLLICFSIPLALVAPQTHAQEERGVSEIRFQYQYQRPKALGAMPRAVHMVTPAPRTKDKVAWGKRKVERLRAALGIALNAKETVVQIDEHKEVLRIKDDRYRFKVYIASGMIKFRDTRLYNRIPEGPAEALSEEEARKRANRILGRLVDVGLVQKDQLLLDAARVSFRKERSAAGARESDQGRYQPGQVQLADTRVFVPRRIDGLGVSGNGVNIVLDAKGNIAGLDLFWRDLRREQKPYPVKRRIGEAKKDFERSIHLAAGSRVDVIAAELVYYDPSKRDDVAFLEPAYLFAYVAREPVQGRRDEYRVSKVLHRIYPALDHGRRQLASERKKRLEAIGYRFERRHPETAEPGTDTEDE